MVNSRMGSDTAGGASGNGVERFKGNLFAFIERPMGTCCSSTEAWIALNLDCLCSVARIVSETLNSCIEAGMSAGPPAAGKRKSNFDCLSFFQIEACTGFGRIENSRYVESGW
jgi:hypothetical protein